MFSESLKCLKKPRSMVIAAMLTAIYIILDQPGLSLHINEWLKINFIFVPVMICAMFYGPVPCAAVCIIGDILGVVLTGKGIVPQLILVELIRGILMGMIMFRKKPTLGRIIFGQSVATLFVNMCLNTAVLIWVGYLSASGVFASIGFRVLKNVIALPIEITILFFLMAALTKAMEKNHIKP